MKWPHFRTVCRNSIGLSSRRFRQSRTRGRSPVVGLILPTSHFSALAIEEILSCHCWKAGSVSGQIVAVTRVYKNLRKIIGGLRVSIPGPH